MPPNRLTCPECEAHFRTAEEVPAGKKVQCPKCGTPVLPSSGWEVVDDAAPTPARRARVRDDDDDYDDEPVRRKKTKKAKKSNVVGIVAAVVVVGILLGLGGVIAGVLWFGKKAEPVASGPPEIILPPDFFEPPPPPPGPDLGKGKGKGPGPTKPTGNVGLNVWDTAMEIEGNDLDGKKFKLSDYRGKVVVLDFWGDW